MNQFVGPAPLPVLLAPSITFDPPEAVQIADVLNVIVTVRVLNSQGPHEVSAELLTPSGFHYQRRAVPIDGPAEQEKTATFVVPVAGTMIAEQKLAGIWSVKLFHDGEALSTPTFELAP
jgi:hypothetical protein